jgi:hypothetical protein
MSRIDEDMHDLQVAAAGPIGTEFVRVYSSDSPAKVVSRNLVSAVACSPLPVVALPSMSLIPSVLVNDFTPDRE